MEEKVEMQEDLTFGEIINLIKKGWVRVLVYCLVGLIIATGVMVTVRAITSTTEYKTQLTFTSDSIKLGGNWTPSDSISEIVKSDVVVTAALNDCGFKTEQQETLLDAGLKSAIAVSVEETMTDASGKEYPSIVNISVTKNTKYKLSNAQYSSLIEALTKKSIDYIKDKYAYDVSIETSLSIDYTYENYLQIYNQLEGILSAYEAYLDSASSDLLSFTSTDTKTSLSVLKAQISTLSNQLDVIYAYLINKKVANNSTAVASSEAGFADQQVSVLTEKESLLNARITAYAALLENCKPVINNYASGDVTVNSDYYEYLEIYNELQEEYTNLCLEKSKWENIQTAYATPDSSDDANTAIQTLIDSFITTYNESATTLKETVADYNETGLFSSIIYESGNVSKEVGEAVGATIIIAIDVVVFIILFVVAVAITKQKETKKAAKEEA